MVSPINGEKPIASSSERLGESAKNNRPEQSQASSAAGSPQQKPAETARDTPQLDQARQLFELENHTARPAGEDITTPEAARSVLGRILEQISSAPEQAIKAQGSVPNPLANLLQTAPG